MKLIDWCFSLNSPVPYWLCEFNRSLHLQDCLEDYPNGLNGGNVLDLNCCYIIENMGIGMLDTNLLATNLWTLILFPCDWPPD